MPTKCRWLCTYQRSTAHVSPVGVHTNDTAGSRQHPRRCRAMYFGRYPNVRRLSGGCARSYKGEIPQRGRVCGAQILNKPVGSEDEAGGLSNTVRRCLNKACNGDGSIFKRDAADQGAACFPEHPSAAHQHGLLAQLGTGPECSSHHRLRLQAQWSGQGWRGSMPFQGLRHLRFRRKASLPSEAHQRAIVPVAGRPVTSTAKQRRQT